MRHPRPVLRILLPLALLAGCAEVPPLETPDEVEAIRAEWEAEAGVEGEAEEAGEDGPEETVEAPADDFVIDVPPPYPSEAARPPADRRAAPDREDGGGPAADDREGSDDATVVRIEPAARERKPRTLFEASEAAKRKRKTAPEARIAITDENLHEYQEGSVTVGGSESAGEADGGESGEINEINEAGEAAGEAVREEEYWRSTVLDLRLRLRAAVDELAELEGRASELRRSFYAQDDPYVRDGEIKPAWDRTLDRIEESRRAILELTRELDATLREGRRAGALPGWLREGGALEPRPEELPEDLRGRAPRTHEPGEPPVLEIEEQEPPPGAV